MKKKRTLKEIALDLLDDYEGSEGIVIDEYCTTNIEKAEKALRARCKKIRKEIEEASKHES